MATWTSPTKSAPSSTVYFKLEIGSNFYLEIGSDNDLRIGGSSAGGDGWSNPSKASTSWTFQSEN